MFERRGETRYELALPVFIGDARGLTRNIGIGGAFVVMPRAFAAGQMLDVFIEITFTDPEMPTRLHCTARVCRVHRVRSAYAIALAFTDVRVLTVALPHSIPAGKPAVL
jgi:hypothetical protein